MSPCPGSGLAEVAVAALRGAPPPGGAGSRPESTRLRPPGEPLRPRRYRPLLLTDRFREEGTCGGSRSIAADRRGQSGPSPPREGPEGLGAVPGLAEHAGPRAGSSAGLAAARGRVFPPLASSLVYRRSPQHARGRGILAPEDFRLIRSAWSRAGCV